MIGFDNSLAAIRAVNFAGKMSTLRMPTLSHPYRQDSGNFDWKAAGRKER